VTALIVSPGFASMRMLGLVCPAVDCAPMATTITVVVGVC